MHSPILALDLGTANIKALAAAFTPNGWRVLQPGQRQSRGIKQGIIIRSQDVAAELDSLISEMEGVLNVDFKSAVVGIAGPHLEMRPSKGTAVVSRADEEITEDDKERADKAAAALAPQRNRELVQTVVKDYVIDGVTEVEDPIGMKGLRLEVNAFLIDAFAPALRKMDHVEEELNLKFNPRFVLPLAGAEMALTSQDKDLGVAALDLGAGTTSLCVYENNELLDLKVFPVGGMHITNDIAVGLRTYVNVAEKLKVNEGIAIAKKVPRGENIDLSQYWEEAEEETTVSKKFLAEIIEARLGEIFDLVANRLKEIDRFGKLPGGIVLYGGGAKLTSVVNLARDKFKLPVRIANPDNEWYKENPDPSFIGVLGLLQSAFSDNNDSSFDPNNFWQQIIAKGKKLLPFK